LVRSWYSQAAAGSQFVGQMYQTGEPQVLSRRTQAGRAPDGRARAEKPAGVRLRGRLLGRERLGRRGDGELAQELEQRQVGPGGRLDPVRLSLGDGHRSTGDGRSER